MHLDHKKMCSKEKGCVRKHTVLGGRGSGTKRTAAARERPRDDSRFSATFTFREVRVAWNIAGNRDIHAELQHRTLATDSRAYPG